VNSLEFDPNLLLAVVHRDTPFRQLQDAVEILRQAMVESEGQLQALVHRHLGRFVVCKDTVQSMLSSHSSSSSSCNRTRCSSS